MIESRICKVEQVPNQDRRFGSNLVYYPAQVEELTGQQLPALFTANEIEVAIARAKRNPEDVPEDKTLWDVLLGR